MEWLFNQLDLSIDHSKPCRNEKSGVVTGDGIAAHKKARLVITIPVMFSDNDSQDLFVRKNNVL